MIAHTGLEVAAPFPGRAIVGLAFVRYEDTDLDAYNELAVSVLVRPHDARPSSARAKALEVLGNRARVYIHHLPVNQTFTLEAGRRIWGYPKFMADIEIAEGPGVASCTLGQGGRRILTLTVREGGALRLPTPSLPTYSFLDGVLRLTPWELRGPVKGRIGGASLALGDHPLADELRTLGLPKRALLTSTMPQMKARFGPPEVVRE